MVLANILAQVVLPTPRGPQNKNACANWLLLIAFFKVVVICSCPTTVSKVWGLYFRAETINFSIQIKSKARLLRYRGLVDYGWIPKIFNTQFSSWYVYIFS